MNQFIARLKSRVNNIVSHFFYAIIYGKWSIGFEYYDGKPMFAVIHTYFDGYHFAIHIWRLWIECDY